MGPVRARRSMGSTLAIPAVAPRHPEAIERPLALVRLETFGHEAMERCTVAFDVSQEGRSILLVRLHRCFSACGIKVAQKIVPDSAGAAPTTVRVRPADLLRGSL